MKIVREEIDYKKQMENNNKNMKKSKETDTVIAVDPTYADAMEQDKKAEEKVGEIMKKKHEEQKSIETPDPSTGKPLKKNMYTEQEELDESLFDGGEGEEVEEEKNPTKLPEDVFTMVYDFIFDGIHKSPASIKGLEDVEDVVVGAEKYFQDVQNFTNIGVQIRNDEKDIAEYVKKIADALGFSTSEKRYERGVKNGDYVLFVEIPKDVAVMKASKFLKEDEGLEEGKKLTESEYTPSELVRIMIEDARGWKEDEPGTDIEEIIEGTIEDDLVSAEDYVTVMRYFRDTDTDELKSMFEERSKQKLVNLLRDRLTKKYSEAYNASIKEEKKLTETIEGEDILDNLVDRAILNLKDGIDSDSTDVETAVERAIDDGLIYNDDILSLGIHYDVVDTDKILSDIYDTLTSDLIGKVTEKLGETYKSTDESLKEEKKINEKGLTRSERHNRMMNKIFDGHDKYVDKMANFLSKRGVSDEEIAELKKGVGLGKDAMRDKIVELGLEDEFKKTFAESKKEKEKKLTEDAKIYISLTDYRPWSGAVDTFEKIRKEDKMDELDAFIEEMYPDGLTDTELNDLLWFEPEYVFDNLGIDYEDEDEEDEDEDDEIELDFEEEDEEETDEE